MRFFTVLPSGTGTNTMPGPTSAHGVARIDSSVTWAGTITTSSSASYTTCQPSTSAHHRDSAATSVQSTTVEYQRSAIGQPRRDVAVLAGLVGIVGQRRLDHGDGRAELAAGAVPVLAVGDVEAQDADGRVVLAVEEGAGRRAPQPLDLGVGRP